MHVHVVLAAHDLQRGDAWHSVRSLQGPQFIAAADLCDFLEGRNRGDGNGEYSAQVIFISQNNRAFLKINVRFISIIILSVLARSPAKYSIVSINCKDRAERVRDVISNWIRNILNGN